MQSSAEKHWRAAESVHKASPNGFIWPVNYIFHKHRAHAIQRVLCPSRANFLAISFLPLFLALSAQFIAAEVPQREYYTLTFQVRITVQSPSVLLRETSDKGVTSLFSFIFKLFAIIYTNNSILR